MNRAISLYKLIATFGLPRELFASLNGEGCGMHVFLFIYILKLSFTIVGLIFAIV